MQGIQKIDIKSLVLSVNKNYDRSKFDMDDWDGYLDILCQDREYQKEAIKTAIIYLASGKYITVKDLLKENFENNIDMQDAYGTLDKLYKSVQLPDMLSGVIDMATGSGKSYVMFGIAHIALLLGLVKRVLVLCPSLTIENGLTEKFQALITRSELLNVVPDKYAKLPIRIIDANSTVQENNICIENIHAVYENTGSSIKDSFTMTGADTLVLSDEVHHAYNSPADKDTAIKKWKEFVQDEFYGFKCHLGFTGTAYKDNDYFADVIFRYSLRQAINEKIVKKVDYVAEDTNDGSYEKFQKILQNHNEMKAKYPHITPLSIIVTAKIDGAKNLMENFLDFLAEFTKEPRESVEKKVLIVTSHKDHKKNIQILKNVDEKDCGIEWIISVSMLTEGWDVKNVFQIVPWEDRAFNSKLLVSQVLGRGLRKPLWADAQPKVIVFNHSNWSKNIKTIVDEVLETEQVLTASIIGSGERSKYNFTVSNLNYEKELYEEINDEYGKEETFDIDKPLDLITQREIIDKSTTYIDTQNNTYNKNYQIKRETMTIEEIAEKIVKQYQRRNREATLRGIQEEVIYTDGKTELEKLPTYDQIVDYIKKCMKLANIVGDNLIEDNVLKINGKFTGLLRKKRTSAGYRNKANEFITIRTSDMRNSSSSYSTLRNNRTVFYSSDVSNELEAEQYSIFKYMQAELQGKQLRQINVYDFKTPQSIVVVSQEPERKFVEMLTKKEVAEKIDCWIKSRDVAFYSITYVLKRGTSPKEFNPDFFIKVDNNIIVIETKADNDTVRENYSKMIDAQKHFEKLNEKLKEANQKERYFFNILSPVSYPTFEKMLKDGTYFNGFNSDLEVKLRNEYPNKNE
ncbi:MAG TPA: DEAD/DEAH box helicase family protein [Oscillospiraceae bacterium]|nr:DEAD/DEAH box helicase family protein [Oscillospiraceae bacterium]HPS34455.1 DEAD/DEAH box helicase family protein [Oscillospiraceae bacterium]